MKKLLHERRVLVSLTTHGHTLRSPARQLTETFREEVTFLAAEAEALASSLAQLILALER